MPSGPISAFLGMTEKEAIIFGKLADVLLPDSDQGNWKVWRPSQGSSAIVQVKHRSKDGVMTVRFTGGPVDYLYSGVPTELFRQWKRVRSAGKFYHRRIKGSYRI